MMRKVCLLIFTRRYVNIEKVKENSALKSLCVGIRDIAEVLNISFGTSQNILVNVLGMKLSMLDSYQEIWRPFAKTTSGRRSKIDA